MTDGGVVEKHFEISDSNRDGQLDSREWLGYMHGEVHNLKRDKNSRILRYVPCVMEYYNPWKRRVKMFWLWLSFYCIVFIMRQMIPFSTVN